MHSADLSSGWLRLRPNQRRMRRYAQLRFVPGSGFLRRRRVQRVWAPDRAGWWRGPLRRANLRGAEHPVRTRRRWLRTSHFLWVVHDDEVLRRRGGAEPVRERRHVRPRDMRAARQRVRIRERRLRRCAGLRWMRDRGALHPREMPRARARAGRRTDLRSAVVCGVTGLLRPYRGRLRRRDRMQRRGHSADAVRLPCSAPSAHHLVLAADLRADGCRVWPGGRWLRQRPRLRIVLASRGLRRRRTEQVRIGAGVCDPSADVGIHIGVRQSGQRGRSSAGFTCVRGSRILVCRLFVLDRRRTWRCSSCVSSRVGRWEHSL